MFFKQINFKPQIKFLFDSSKSLSKINWVAAVSFAGFGLVYGGKDLAKNQTVAAYEILQHLF